MHDSSSVSPSDRYQTIVALLQQVIEEQRDLREHLDEIDRAVLRPYGDGTRIRSRRRRAR
jgi:hypothetical protein